MRLPLPIAFLLVALVAAFLGFGGAAGPWEGAAKVCFFVFLVLAAMTLVGGALNKQSPRD
jgi:uncharacterized membrane protein YtjA (UPF0391 family)